MKSVAAWPVRRWILIAATLPGFKWGSIETRSKVYDGIAWLRLEDWQVRDTKDGVNALVESKMDVSDIEMRACELSYEKSHGQNLGYAEIPEDERDVILQEIRARVLLVEQHVTHDMLVRKIGEERWTPRRFMGPALVTAVVMAAVIILGLGVMQLLSSH